MTQVEIIKKLQDLQELKRLAEEISAEIEAAQDEVKAYMDAAGVDQMTAGAFKVTWKAVTSSRLDSTALKKALPEIAAQFTKQTTSRRFCVG